MDKQWVKELHSQFPVAEKLAFFDIAYENCGNDFVRQAQIGRASCRERV